MLLILVQAALPPRHFATSFTGDFDPIKRKGRKFVHFTLRIYKMKSPIPI